MKEKDTNEVMQGQTTETATKSKKRRAGWKTNRKLRLGTTATVLTAVVVAAAVVFNIIVGILYDRFPLSLDLTPDNTFTLSEESRTVAKNVKKDVEILAFLEESIFSAPATGSDELNTVLRQFHLFTKDYQSLSGGRVTTKYLDMETNPTLSTTYKEYDIQSGDILFRCGKDYRVITLEDLYSEEYDSTTYAAVYSSMVEQKLASTINAICGGKTVNLTFLTGHGENETLISIMQDIYELNGYTTSTLNLASASEISEYTEAMIIAGPLTDFSVDEITRLRSWLRNNDKLNHDLVVLCNYLGECPNLYDFLASDYGITVTDNLVVETNTDNYLMMYSDGAFAPVTTVEDSDVTSEIFDQKIIMPYTLQLLKSFGTDQDKEAVTNHSLITFPESAELIPQESLGENSTSAQIKADDYPINGMVYAKELFGESGETNVIVSGSYQFPGYAQLTQYANEAMVLEPMRAICSLGDTVVISGQSLTAPTLSYSVSEARAIEIIMIVIPVALIAVCLVVFLKRRHL